MSERRSFFLASQSHTYHILLLIVVPQPLTFTTLTEPCRVCIVALGFWSFLQPWTVWTLGARHSLGNLRLKLENYPFLLWNRWSPNYVETTSWPPQSGGNTSCKRFKQTLLCLKLHKYCHELRGQELFNEIKYEVVTRDVFFNNVAFVLKMLIILCFLTFFSVIFMPVCCFNWLSDAISSCFKYYQIFLKTGLDSLCTATRLYY